MAFRNRIVETGVMPADQFLAHPDNPKFHPQFQRDVMKGILGEVGFVSGVIVSARTGYVLDGHDRIFEALDADNSDVPYQKVDVTEQEEAYILATFDPVGRLAFHDAEQLDTLLATVNSDSEAVQAMLNNLAAANTIPDGGTWDNAFDGLATGEKSPFQQMTFTLHDDQAEQVQAALDLAKMQGAFVDSPNANSNGNALARICETFITMLAVHGQR